MFVKVAFLLKAMICRELSIVFKVIVQTGLFLLFLFFFGIPAVEKYLRAETVIITWEEDTGGIEPLQSLSPAPSLEKLAGKALLKMHR